MTSELIFLLQAFVIITVPFTVSRLLRLDGMVPLVVIQILLGIGFGPSLFGRIAPQAYGMLFNDSTLGPLSGAASIAVLFFGFITWMSIPFEAGAAPSRRSRRRASLFQPVLARPQGCSSQSAIPLNWARGETSSASAPPSAFALA
jgi:hypothetical protein